jgi:rhodanese-related sulfurtransferase
MTANAGSWTVAAQKVRYRSTRERATKGRDMPTHIGRDDVQRLVAEGAQLVEVLPKKEFDEQRLPGAIHLPLRKIDAGGRASLDPERPVILYCWDSA